MKFKLLLVLAVFIPFLIASDLSNHIGKTPAQLSDMEDYVTISNTSYWNNHAYQAIADIVQRLNLKRNSADYTFATAVDSGYVFEIAPNDTVAMTAEQELANNFALIGNGPTSIIRGSAKTSTTAYAMIQVDGDTNVIIKDIKFERDTTNSATYATEYDAIIDIRGPARNIFIVNCDFTCLGDGIYIGGTSDSTNFPQDIFILGCKFYGDSLSAFDPPCARNGVSVTGGKNIVVSNNIFDGFWNVGCIDVEPNKNGVTRSIGINNNKMFPRGWGVTLSGGTMENVSISSNVIDGSKYNNCQGGIHVSANTYSAQDAYKNVVINGNVVYGVTDNTYGGIYIGGLNGFMQVVNNSVYNCSTDGILVNPLSKGMIVTGNEVRNNGKNGINMFGLSYDSTSTVITDASMNSDNAAWISIGTPTTNDTSSAYVFADSVSRKIVTDAANEGLGQILGTGIGDAPTVYDIYCWVFIETASTMTRKIKLDVGGAIETWTQEEVTGPNSQDGRGWTKLRCLFIPSGTDTVKVTASLATTTFYVDSMKIYSRHGHLYANVSNNTVVNNNRVNSTHDGIYTNCMVRSKVNGNNVYHQPNSTSDDTLHIDSIDLTNFIMSTALDNHASGGSTSDLYINGIALSALSFIGIETPFYLTTSYADQISWPYAKAMYFMEDSIAQGRSSALMSWGSASSAVRFPMPSDGRIVSMAAALSDSVTADTAIFYPQIGFQVSGDISDRTYLYCTIVGADTPKVQYDIEPIMTTEFVKFRAGDFVGVSLYTSASFTKENSTATATLLWE